MPSPEECRHDELVIGSLVEESSSNGEAWMALRLSVRCDACGVLFSWAGLNSGIPNPREPVVSADGYELRAPIVPRPGATVGVLMRAGLEQKLQPPVA